MSSPLHRRCWICPRCGFHRWRCELLSYLCQLLWKSYIDFETEIGQFDRARDLYKRLLQRTQHVKVWISYAQFEAALESEEALAEARAIYEQADKELKKSEDKSERLLLLESWVQFEQTHGTAATVRSIQAKLPKKLKKKREILRDDGTNEGWEEYFEYVYPDEQNTQSLKVCSVLDLPLHVQSVCADHGEGLRVEDEDAANATEATAAATAGWRSRSRRWGTGSRGRGVICSMHCTFISVQKQSTLSLRAGHRGQLITYLIESVQHRFQRVLRHFKRHALVTGNLVHRCGLPSNLRIHGR